MHLFLYFALSQENCSSRCSTTRLWIQKLLVERSLFLSRFKFPVHSHRRNKLDFVMSYHRVSWYSEATKRGVHANLMC